MTELLAFYFLAGAELAALGAACPAAGAGAFGAVAAPGTDGAEDGAAGRVFTGSFLMTLLLYC